MKFFSFFKCEIKQDQSRTILQPSIQLNHIHKSDFSHQVESLIDVSCSSDSSFLVQFSTGKLNHSNSNWSFLQQKIRKTKKLWRNVLCWERKSFNHIATLEAGHSIRLGGFGCCGSTSNQKHSHAGFWLIDVRDANASCSVRTRREVGLTAAAAAAVLEVQIQIKSCVCGNNPWGGTPFFQGVGSLDTLFYFLSWSAQTAVFYQGNIIWGGQEKWRTRYFRSSYCSAGPPTLFTSKLQPTQMLHRYSSESVRDCTDQGNFTWSFYKAVQNCPPLESTFIVQHM